MLGIIFKVKYMVNGFTQEGQGSEIKIVSPAQGSVQRAKSELKRQLTESIEHSPPKKKRKKPPTAKKKKTVSKAKSKQKNKKQTKKKKATSKKKKPKPKTKKK